MVFPIIGDGITVGMIGGTIIPGTGAGIGIGIPDITDGMAAGAGHIPGIIITVGMIGVGTDLVFRLVPGVAQVGTAEDT